jgi:hypothetical protein
MISAFVRARALRSTSPSALLRRASTSPRTRGGYLERTSTRRHRRCACGHGTFSEVKEATIRVIVAHRSSNEYPRVRLVLADGSEVDAQPLGCDPFEVLRTLRTAISLCRS